jgi:sugar lactone lactonase YvrE
MTSYRTTTLAEGLAFPEGPRWHEGRLWFTDQHARRIYALSPDGGLETIAETSDLPGGLGWLPDGRLLVVYMTERRIMQRVDGQLSTYADLSGLASFHCNDMVIDREGRIYAGNFGFDLHGGAAQSKAELIQVDPDGDSRVVSRDLVFPNGSAITPNGATLLVAETFGHRIRAFPLDARGNPGTPTIWAELGDTTPDGICLDADDHLWIASPGTRALIRVKPGGAIVDECVTSGTPYACMLGGGDRRTLYVCSAETDDPQQAAARRSGRIEQVRVDVAGAGLP